MNPDHKYYPKTIDQKLGYLVEECGEVMAAVGKAQRWGLSSEINREWILRELTDLEAACAIVRKALDGSMGGASS